MKRDMVSKVLVVTINLTLLIVGGLLIGLGTHSAMIGIGSICLAFFIGAKDMI